MQQAIDIKRKRKRALRQKTSRNLKREKERLRENCTLGLHDVAIKLQWLLNCRFYGFKNDCRYSSSQRAICGVSLPSSSCVRKVVQRLTKRSFPQGPLFLITKLIYLIISVTRFGDFLDFG